MFAPGEQVRTPTAEEIAAAHELGRRFDPFGDFLRETVESGQQRRAERTAQGVPPSEGFVDWNGLMFDMFGIRPEGSVAPPAAPIPRLAAPGEGVTEDQRLAMLRLGIDPESGLIFDPRTGSYYPRDRLPSETGYGIVGPERIAESVGGAIQSEIGRVGDILFPQGEETVTAEVPLPRRRPAGAPGGIDMAVPPEAGMLPGQTEGMLEITVPYGESDEARYARTHPVASKEEPSILDRVVEGAGTILENTTLGGAVKTLFPDVWFGVGETIKGLGSGGTGSAPRGFTDTSQWPFTSPEGTGTLATPSDTPSLVGFIDLNHNGIDDRLEGYVPPPVTPPPSGTPTSNYDRFGSVVFPDLPPYRPGRDDEWLYFRRNMAHGGLVRGYAEGGEVSPLAGQDPRIEVIAETEDVLEGIIGGEPPGEEEIVVLKSFVEQFGDAALKQLHDNVKAGMKMREGKGRMVEGPGGPTDDAVPAMIDGNEPAALSDGEFVMTSAAVEAAGDGDRELGAERLMELNDRLANMGKKAA